MKRLSLRLLAITLPLFLVVFAGAVLADTFAYSFYSKGTVKVGQVVALVAGSKNTVELASAKNTQAIYGVVVDMADAPLAVESTGQNTIVATSGIHPVMSSTQNGSIKTGDYLSMSDTDGIAAKVKGRQTYIIGQAMQNFNGSTGLVSANIIPGKNPNLIQDTAVPAPLRRIGESIAGKPLAASRIYAAMIIFMVTAALALSLLWVGVRSGMISLGRNPLSKRTILRGLVQVIAASIIVFAGGLIGVYLFLRI